MEEEERKTDREREGGGREGERENKRRERKKERGEYMVRRQTSGKQQESKKNFFLEDVPRLTFNRRL